MNGLRFHLPDEQATAALGAALAQVLSTRGAGTIHLVGDLGAGKSSLARGFLRALGASGAIRSPTYTLLEPYQLGVHRALHMDLYRLVDAEELHQLGLSDYPPDSTLWLVEWPQRGVGVLPPPDVEVQLAISGAGRTARLECPSTYGRSLEAELQRRLIGKFQSLP
jgi:tRNA threonylcarbamoyladenosine biosynthesis protein TsaE